ncbi:hypothetical protein HDV00_010457 [Rhizophlyctis rosea]|nr:hypothetical protein HDV00_010457 [Rhizophlyctis rosea]
MTLKGKYACAIAEMNETKIAPDVAKSIAGGDGASARHGLGREEKFRHTCKVIIAANNLPKIEDKTDGTWDKLVVIPFQAKFVDDPKAPHEHLIDLTLEKKLLACADTLLALIVDYHPTYCQQGVRKPQYPTVVRELTQEYRHRYNIFQQFVDLWVVQKRGVKLLSKDLVTKLAHFCNLYKYANTPVLQREIRDILEKMSLRGNISIKVAKNEGVNGWEVIPLRDEPWTLGDLAEAVQGIETQQDVEMECEATPQEAADLEKARAPLGFKVEPAGQHAVTEDDLVEVEETDEEYALRTRIEDDYGRPCRIVDDGYSQPGANQYDSRMKWQIKR